MPYAIRNIAFATFPWFNNLNLSMRPTEADVIKIQHFSGCITNTGKTYASSGLFVYVRWMTFSFYRVWLKIEIFLIVTTFSSHPVSVSDLTMQTIHMRICCCSICNTKERITIHPRSVYYCLAVSVFDLHLCLKHIGHLSSSDLALDYPEERKV